MATAAGETGVPARSSSKMKTGRARGKLLGIWLDDVRFEAVARLAEQEGVTKTALIERWIDERAAPLPEGTQAAD